MDPLDLGARATFVSRQCWLHGDVLSIEQQPARGAAELSCYRVEELDPLPGLVGRVFRLHPLGRRGGEVYRVVVGGLPSCSCKSGQCRRELGADACKHLAALTALAEAEFQPLQPQR